MTPATAITTAPLDAAALARALDVTGAGAVAMFVGLVRDNNLGRRVLHLEYEAYEPLALRGLDLIVEEARERWPAVRLMIHHRIGRMEIGEASVAIAAASPHRADAFCGDAVRDRAHQADCADLEARVLRGRRRVDRGRHRRSRQRRRARESA